MPGQHVLPQIHNMADAKLEYGRKSLNASLTVNSNHPYSVIVAIQAECKVPAELYIEPKPIAEEFGLIDNEITMLGTSSPSIDFGWNIDYELLKHRDLGEIMHCVVKPTGEVPAAATSQSICLRYPRVSGRSRERN